MPQRYQAKYRKDEILNSITKPVRDVPAYIATIPSITIKPVRNVFIIIKIIYLFGKIIIICLLIPNIGQILNYLK